MIISARVLNSLKMITVTSFITLSSLTACNKSDVNTTDEVDISVSDIANSKVLNNGQILTIYSSRPQEALTKMLDKFSNQTGITIELVVDDAEILIARLEEEGANTSADLFITSERLSLWQAAKKGILQQINSPIIEKNIPLKFRDVENRWTGLSYDANTILYDAEVIDKAELSSYEALSQKKWQGKLCLTDLTDANNQLLIAMMIHNIGIEKTKNVVKGWLQNLAQPTFDNDQALLQAMVNKQCAVALASTSSYAHFLEQAALKNDEQNQEAQDKLENTEQVSAATSEAEQTTTAVDNAKTQTNKTPQNQAAANIASPDNKQTDKTDEGTGVSEDVANESPVQLFWANQDSLGTIISIAGAGVPTNADNPSVALDLMEWLSDVEVHNTAQAISNDYSIVAEDKISKELASLGSFKENKLQLSTLVELQPEAASLLESIQKELEEKRKKQLEEKQSSNPIMPQQSNPKQAPPLAENRYTDKQNDAMPLQQNQNQNQSQNQDNDNQETQPQSSNN